MPEKPTGTMTTNLEACNISRLKTFRKDSYSTMQCPSKALRRLLRRHNVSDIEPQDLYSSSSMEGFPWLMNIALPRRIGVRRAYETLYCRHERLSRQFKNKRSKGDGSCVSPRAQLTSLASTLNRAHDQ
ncbi:uncharacterized protein ARMOST_18355 [Armillaria ostoyae]|uniref:Uncharacterized protein n=1 Tax=Armillaria ostoyae TaxID=47428 RepID=A0A284S1K7_ARMOS|nr:uncharacterized protein ARMOST_18355 [Armillaria ostoyae]